MRDADQGTLPQLYDIFNGEVANVQTYGAFVKIPGCRKQGLVHKSQMSSARIDDPSEMLAKGEKVYCKVIAMEGDGEKISLSMKVVNQTTGKDLDPNNVQASLDEKKRRKWNFKGENKIELGAELNTVCRRCGGHGHFAMDCFSGQGDNQYDLIPDLDKLTELLPVEERAPKAPAKKKKKDKKKKDKKKKGKKRHSSPSESEQSSGEEEVSSRKRKSRQRSSSHGGEGRKKRRHSGRDSSSDCEREEGRERDGGKDGDKGKGRERDSFSIRWDPSQRHTQPVFTEKTHPEDTSGLCSQKRHI
ncbi:nucleolar protein of 40 kDa [Aplysia californica]|uniref:Nucleolar protein of 40 kDa n=1 Tax=Aplysia californica TaxID=6500 RepID=A0ABM1VVY4_APLCA|nr:nucleolar protein of 40 kDa [Aplysia californica]